MARFVCSSGSLAFTYSWNARRIFKVATHRQSSSSKVSSIHDQLYLHLDRSVRLLFVKESLCERKFVGLFEKPLSLIDSLAGRLFGSAWLELG